MTTFREGNKVSVRVSKPYYGWGAVTKKSIGIVVGASSNMVIVKFPENKKFLAKPNELKLFPIKKPVAKRGKIKPSVII